jgi:hypothetical protein
MDELVIVIVLWVVGSIVVYIFRSIKRKKMLKEMPGNEELEIYVDQIRKLKAQNASYVDQVNYLKNKGLKSQKLIDAVIASVESSEE